MVCTPHLGASTAEAQEEVAYEIAEAVIGALKVGCAGRSYWVLVCCGVPGVPGLPSWLHQPDRGSVGAHGAGALGRRNAGGACACCA